MIKQYDQLNKDRTYCHHPQIQKDLQYIFNSPSTFNKILGLLTVRFKDNHRLMEIILNDQYIIRTYNTPRDVYYRLYRIQLWVDCSFPIVEPMVILR